MPKSEDLEFLRPTWVEINLKALKKNINKLKRTSFSSKFLFVVKADAYGHGIVKTARFSKNLVWGFGVSSVEEGIVLRKARIKNPILILGSLYPFKSFLEAIKYDLTVTISSLEAARQIIKASRKAGKKASCHIKVETGMGRMGARKPSARKIFNKLNNSKFVFLKGAYTHFSSADSDWEYTKLQLSRFNETIKEFGALPKNFIRHAANSHAAVHFPATRLDMVRCGFACYGLMKGFEPVMSLKTRIVFIKNVRKGAFISYGKTFQCRRPMKIATLPLGYADGYIRAYSNKARVLIKGERCRVLGAVTMDMIMTDISKLENVSIGEKVEIFGNAITANELSKKTGISPYEIVTLISERVPRIYKNRL